MMTPPLSAPSSSPWSELEKGLHCLRLEVDESIATSLFAILDRARLHVEQAHQQTCDELETERMRLAACMAAALGNTPESVAQRIAPGHPYWSASYGDVCKAVDREMALRGQLSTAQQEIERLTVCVNEIENHCPCGARPEAPWTHPHMIGCPVERAKTILSHLKGATTPHD